MPYKGKIDRFNYVKYLRFFLPKASTNIIKLYGEILVAYKNDRVNFS